MIGHQGALDSAHQATPIDRRRRILRVQLRLGHPKLETTVRYVGIEVDRCARNL